MCPLSFATLDLVFLVKWPDLQSCKYKTHDFSAPYISTLENNISRQDDFQPPPPLYKTCQTMPSVNVCGVYGVLRPDRKGDVGS